MNHSKERAGINQQELESRCRDIAAAAGVEPATCSVRKLSPAEALSVKLPIPWTGKVHPADKSELTPDLFNRLQDFGLATSEIETLFGYSLNCIYPFLKRNGIKPKPIYPGRVLTRPSKSASKKTAPGTCADIEKFFMEPPTEETVASGLAMAQSHYLATDRQPIEVMQEFLSPEQFIGFLRGNVVKYTLRAGRKDEQRKEIDKVVQYATWWRQVLDGKTIDPREAAK